MILNGIEVSDGLIRRFLTLSALPGNEHIGLKQSKYVSSLAIANNLPTWMKSIGVDYFNEGSLIEENLNLCADIISSDHWILGNKVCDIYPGKISPSDIILIAYNLMGENFLGLYRSGSNLCVVATDKVKNIYCWRTIFESFEDFLDSFEL